MAEPHGQPHIDSIKRRMDSAVDVLRKEFGGLRTGRASAALLDPVVVEAYGNKMPLSQLGTVGVPDPRMLSVQVWDKGLVKSVEKAIRDAGLGLNPQVDGQTVRVPIPQLNTERRNELTKLEKDHKISQDEHKTWGDQIQKLTDEHVKIIDQTLAQKSQEISQV